MTRCSMCNSLERWVMHRVFDVFAPTYTQTKRLLQFVKAPRSSRMSAGKFPTPPCSSS